MCLVTITAGTEILIFEIQASKSCKILNTNYTKLLAKQNLYRTHKKNTISENNIVELGIQNYEIHLYAHN